MEENKGLVRITLVVVMLTSFITPFIGNAINLAIPQIGAEFHGNQFWLNWVVTSYLLASATFLLPFGRLADIVGRKKIFTVGIVLFALTSLACGLAFSMLSLIIFRVLQGIAGAMVYGTAMAILTSVVPPQKKGRAMGMSVAATYTGLSLGPVVGGLLCTYFSWRGIFYVNFAIAVIALALTVFKLHGEWWGQAGAKFDTWGSLFYLLGLSLFLYGLSDITSAWYFQVACVLGLFFIIGFLWYEAKAKYPLLPISFFTQNRAFAFSNLAALINYSATFALTFVLSLYLQSVLGFDTTLSGLILLSQPIIMAVLSPFAGRFSDRIAPQILSSLGMGLTTVGLFLFIFLGRNTSVVLIMLNLALIGFSFALFSSPNTNAVMSSVERAFYGIASSTLGTMRLLGQAISMAIVALITSIYIGNTSLTSSQYVPQYMSSLKVSFVIFTVLCFLGVFASLARGKRGTPNHASNNPGPEHHNKQKRNVSL